MQNVWNQRVDYFYPGKIKNLFTSKKARLSFYDWHSLWRKTGYLLELAGWNNDTSVSHFQAHVSQLLSFVSEHASSRCPHWLLLTAQVCMTTVNTYTSTVYTNGQRPGPAIHTDSLNRTYSKKKLKPKNLKYSGFSRIFLYMVFYL
jgi:hypothetical protein